jgi:hypothetical protein
MTRSINEDIGGFALAVSRAQTGKESWTYVSMNDRGSMGVQVLESFGDIEHQPKLSISY